MNFIGINENNINFIRDNFDSTIVVRGENLFIKGKPEEIDILDKVFKELIYLQKRQGEITERDINLVIELVDDIKFVGGIKYVALATQKNSQAQKAPAVA